MSKKFYVRIILILTVAIMLAGCAVSFNTGAGTSGPATDGGIYKSVNKGMNWQQKALILTTGIRRNIAPLDFVSLALDPTDNKAVYAGSLENGLFYSYDGGEGWQAAADLGKVTVANIAIDPNDRCVIYAAAGNKLYKSVDCNRSWSVVYFDTDLNVVISSLALESNNSNNIFIGTSRGEIIKSSDRGASWKTLNRFNNQVSKIVISPFNAKNIFVGTLNTGIFRSTDAGSSWVSLANKLKNFDGGGSFRDLIIVGGGNLTIFLATNYGLLKSTDGGDVWTKIELITPKAEAKINAIIVNPFDANEIYYVTDTTFYRSLDGGKNWSSKKLPTNRAGWKLAIDPKNPNVIYLAVRQKK
jgi:photosystem II stability/assembly factor-like uncharacterized protein